MYIEKIILIGFIIDYMIFDIETHILKRKINTFDNIISSLLAQLHLIINILNINVIYIRIIINILSLLLPILYFSKTKKLRIIIENLFWFICLSFISGGLIFSLKEHVNYKCIFLLLIPLVLDLLKCFISNISTSNKLKKYVDIYLKNSKKISLYGFIDTGNTMIDPLTNKEVIFIDKDIGDNYYMMPVETVNGKMLLKCFKPKKIFIEDIGTVDAVVAVSNTKFKNYDCLLNYNIWRKT